MKFLKVLLSVVVVLGVLAGVSVAAQIGTTANKPCPIYSSVGAQSTVTAAATQATVGTACSANVARQDGQVLNVSTFTLKCSFTAGTTTAIDAAFFLLYPTGDAYSRDRIDLKRNEVVYQGAMYFYGYDAALGTGVASKRAGKVSRWEWK